MYMENLANGVKRKADPGDDYSLEKRKRLGGDFWDVDWNCMNSNSEWSDDETFCIKQAVNSKLH